MKLEDILAQERRARMAAERLLAQKQAELSDANKMLSAHARDLSEEIVEKRVEVAEVRGENTQVRADLERAAKEVVIAKRRLWDSLETIEDGFAVFDQNERMIVANAAYLKPFDNMECVVPGITYNEILQIILDEGVIDIEGRRPLEWRDMMLARWRAPKIEPQTVRLWDGTYVKLVDRRSSEGDTVSLGLDITETIKYEAELKEARIKAEAANRAKSAFLANMSHEIRTPMNGVVGIAELMAEGDLDDEQRVFVETIKKSGEALLTIINDVLDYSKIEAAKLTLHLEEFDMERKIHDVVTLLQPSVKEKGLELSVDFDVFMPTKVQGDPVRLGQVLTNLIGNAVKFTERGHVLVRVLGLPIDGGAKQKIHITVEDSGIGIAPELQSHIFGEFNQVEEERNRKFEGTGLGLAITQQLVELMGGEIWVESEVGAGSCFGLHVTLPVVEEVRIPKLPLHLETAILCMEDGLHRSIMEKSLQALGLSVICAEQATEMPVHFKGASVLFIEEDLPQNRTAEFLDHVAKHSPTSHKMLLVSPSAHSGLPEALLEKVDGTLSMPILRGELFGALEQIDTTAIPPAPDAAPQQPVVQVGFTSRRQEPEQTTEACADSFVFQHNALPVSPAAQEPEAATTELRTMRVLAAEDNKTNQLVFSKLVKALDIELKFANNGREAVEAFTTFVPDIIFMDISMPEVDGKEATRCIRALEEEQNLPRTRIVALTAHAMTGDAEEILSNGLDKHLTKPLKKPAILAEIGSSCPESARPPFEDEG